MSAVADAGALDGSVETPAKTYRFTPQWRVVAGVLYALLLCGSLWAMFGIASSEDVPLGRKLAAELVVVAFAAGTVWQLVVFLTWRVTLAPDAIETSTWWRTRRLRREDIAGARLNSTRQGGQTLILVPKDNAGKVITLALRFIARDEPFATWFAGLTDLNVVDLRNSFAHIAANAAFGVSVEQRLRRLLLARRFATILDIATLAVVLWAFIGPQPYAWLIGSLVALPIVALLLVIGSLGLFRIGISASDAHANLGAVCALPACVITARLLLDLNMVDWVPLIIAALACAAVFVAALALADRNLRRHPWMLAGIALLTSAYAFGSLGEANALLDRSHPSVLRSQILDKRISYGRTTTYRFKLAPWGPLGAPKEVSVPQEIYARLEPGKEACLLLHDGMLGMPWFVVLACR
jgi:hypothetical protein